ncbi:hypothetical protein [Ramlibacter sp.]|uniref:hypothetical protein n=1 Tax=Ramlibacter sp. TaxID=1917967 RepID=UPI003D0F83A0
MSTPSISSCRGIGLPGGVAPQDSTPARIPELTHFRAGLTGLRRSFLRETPQALDELTANLADSRSVRSDFFSARLKSLGNLADREPTFLSNWDDLRRSIMRLPPGGTADILYPLAEALDALENADSGFRGLMVSANSISYRPALAAEVQRTRAIFVLPLYERVAQLAEAAAQSLAMNRRSDAADAAHSEAAPGPAEDKSPLEDAVERLAGDVRLRMRAVHSCDASLVQSAQWADPNGTFHTATPAEIEAEFSKDEPLLVPGEVEDILEETLGHLLEDGSLDLSAMRDSHAAEASGSQRKRILDLALDLLEKPVVLGWCLSDLAAENGLTRVDHAAAATYRMPGLVQDAGDLHLQAVGLKVHPMKTDFEVDLRGVTNFPPVIVFDDENPDVTGTVHMPGGVNCELQTRSGRVLAGVIVREADSPDRPGREYCLGSTLSRTTFETRV